MTVKEFIEELKKYDENQEIIVKDDVCFHHKPHLYEDDYDEFGVVLVICEAIE